MIPFEIFRNTKWNNNHRDLRLL